MSDTGTDAKPQTIFRAVHGKENPYFMHRRKTAQDKRLSFEARGLLGYLLSKPDDWEISESDLRKEGGIGRDKVKKLITELVKYGYMTKEQPHDSDKGRFLQNVYVTHETPLTEKPSTGLPSTVNPQEHNTDSLDTTEEQTTASAVGLFDNSTPPEDDFRLIQEHTVNVVFGGNVKKFGAAGDIANWACCGSTKDVWRLMHPDAPFTIDEWKAFCLWYSEKLISWPSKPDKWNGQAYEFRHDGIAWRSFIARINPPPPVEPVSDEVLAETMRKMGLVVAE